MGKPGWLSLAIAALLLVIPMGGASPAALDAHIVTMPLDATTQSTRGGYLNAVVVADVAGTLTLTNADIAAHDVVSDAAGPSDNPWCVRYAGKPCPLFASPLVPLGEQAVVEGIDQLVPLTPYTFTCSIHSWMTGTLVAI